MKAAWESYILTPGYIGDSPEAQTQRNRLPVALKVREWVNAEQWGEIEKTYNEKQERMINVMVRNPNTNVNEAEYKFKLPGNSKMVITEDQLATFRILEKKEIRQKKNQWGEMPTSYFEGLLTIEDYRIDREEKLFNKEVLNIAFGLNEEMGRPKIVEIPVEIPVEIARALENEAVEVTEAPFEVKTDDSGMPIAKLTATKHMYTLEELQAFGWQDLLHNVAPKYKIGALYGKKRVDIERAILEAQLKDAISD